MRQRGTVAPLFAGPGGAALVEESLHEQQIQPAPELVTHLAEFACRREAESRVKANRRGVRCVDAADHDVLVQCDGAGEQRFHQLSTDPGPSPIGPYMDTVLDCV